MLMKRPVKYIDIIIDNTKLVKQNLGSHNYILQGNFRLLINRQYHPHSQIYI